ncbi:MAG: DNA polymerase III subunit gamma/tau [Pseudomonadota bacterium]
MAYEVLARKWRPQVFQDVVGQEHITQTLINAMRADRLAHAYLFSGARGVGKTSVARILAKAINCMEDKPGSPCNKCHSCIEITNGSSIDVREIDGASNRGIDEIRELRENIRYMPSSGRFRVYIIDEVHMLTLPAFNALLKTLEEPPPHVKFIFATTESHKVPVTILSRCQKFDFKRIPLSRIVGQMEKIATSEGIEISKSGLALIAREAEGSMRDAESLLDQVVSYTGQKVENEHITDILGLIDRSLVFETSLAILEGSSKKCLEIVDRVYNYGYDIKEFYRAIMDQFRNLLVSLISPDENLLDMIESDREELVRQAKMAGTQKLQQGLTLLIAREENLRLTSHPRLVLETILIKLCHLGELLSFDELMGKIEALEKRLSASSVSSDDRPSGGYLSEPEVPWESPGGKKEAPEARGGVPTKEDWDRFLDDLSSKSKAMANVLKDWSFQNATEDTLEIGRGTSAFSATYLDEPERLQKFVSFCRQFFNRELKIKIVGSNQHDDEKNHPSKKGTPDREGHNNHSSLPEPVQNVLNAFQGEIRQGVHKRNGVEGKENKPPTTRRNDI